MEMLMVDLLMSPDPLRRARQLESLRPDIACAHTGIDVQKALHSRLRVSRTIRELTKALRIPVAAAGGVYPETARALVEAGVKVVVVGGWITGAKDPARASQQAMQKIFGP